MTIAPRTMAARAAPLVALAALAALAGARGVVRPAATVADPSATPNFEAEPRRGARAQSTHSNDPLLAGVILTHPSGRVKLGVRPEGTLNVEPVGGFSPGVTSVGGVQFTGQRFVDVDDNLGSGEGAEFEATAFGCKCQYWTVQFSVDGETNADGEPEPRYGWTNADGEFVGENVEVVAFNVSDACLSDTDKGGCVMARSSTVVAGCLSVVHEFRPSNDSDLAFTASVEFENQCDGNITSLSYSRSHDYDVDPVAFREIVILNPGDAKDLECLLNAPFCSGDPADAADDACTGECAVGEQETVLPAGDNGATFRFRFDSVVNSTVPMRSGDKWTMRTVYGSATSRAEADDEINALTVEAYSLAQSAMTGDNGIQHFYGFSGISGTPLVILPKLPDIPGNGTATLDCDCAATRAVTTGRRVGVVFEADANDTDACLRRRTA